MRNVKHVQVRNKYTDATATVPESSLRLHEPAGWEVVKDDGPAAGAASKAPAPSARAEEPKPTESTAAATPARRDEKKEK